MHQNVIFYAGEMSDAVKNLYYTQTQSHYYISRTVSKFYGTEIEIWAGFRANNE